MGCASPGFDLSPAVITGAGYSFICYMLRCPWPGLLSGWLTPTSATNVSIDGGGSEGGMGMPVGDTLIRLEFALVVWWGVYRALAGLFCGWFGWLGVFSVIALFYGPARWFLLVWFLFKAEVGATLGNPFGIYSFRSWARLLEHSFVLFYVTLRKEECANLGFFASFLARRWIFTSEQQFKIRLQNVLM